MSTVGLPAPPAELTSGTMVGQIYRRLHQFPPMDRLLNSHSPQTSAQPLPQLVRPQSTWYVLVHDGRGRIPKRALAATRIPTIEHLPPSKKMKALGFQAPGIAVAWAAGGNAAVMLLLACDARTMGELRAPSPGAGVRYHRGNLREA